MSKPIKNPIILIAGGKSHEHEISLMSADYIEDLLTDICEHLGRINISKSGTWSCVHPVTSGTPTSPEHLIHAYSKYLTGSNCSSGEICIFPITHGSFGEDGCLQGFLELCEFSYVGTGILGSAATIDKAVAKRLCEQLGILTLPWTEVFCHDWQNTPEHILTKIQEHPGLSGPWIVKPVSLGSSIGVRDAKNQAELKEAISLALNYDDVVIVEKYLHNKTEIECAVLGEYYDLAISAPCEVWNKDAINSYQDKYFAQEPDIRIAHYLGAELTQTLEQNVAKIFSFLRLSGMCRIDWLYSKTNRQLYFSECNTIPGLGPRSHYIRLWDLSGKKIHDLLIKLLDLSMMKGARRKMNTMDVPVQKNTPMHHASPPLCY